MIRETYLANWRNIPPYAVKIAVTRTARSILSPSPSLLKAYKSGEIDWAVFEEWFTEEITGNPEAMKKLREIKELAKTRDVYLVCYEKRFPCHRFILTKIIETI